MKTKTMTTNTLSKIVISMFVLCSLLAGIIPVNGSSIKQTNSGLSESIDNLSSTQLANSLLWPMPEKPIPHHNVGHVSDALEYTTPIQVVNERGVLETVEINGLDAMAADGIDPFAGNYTMINLDKIFRSSKITGTSNLQLTTFELTNSPSIGEIPGSDNTLGVYPSNDIAAGDLNNDGFAEQIVAYLDGDSTVNFY
ncbi:MAG: hypothetical protein MUO67_10695, partial [Anaerolineales bacterium]|nr:hypothetical protein [Anaerolineales bacterium]